jgi:hypothetical protein
MFERKFYIGHTRDIYQQIKLKVSTKENMVAGNEERS